MVRDHTIEDYLASRSLFGVEASDDGSMVMCISSSVFKEKKKPMDSQVVLFDSLSGNITGRFHYDGERITVARFSPDSKRVAFLSFSADRHWITISSISGGGSEKIALDSDAHDIHWMNDGSLLLLMTDPESPEAKARMEKGDDGFYFEEDDRFQSLYHLIPGQGITRITSSVQIWEFSVSGDKIGMVVSHQPQESSWYHAGIWVMDAGTWRMKELYRPEWRTVARPRISPDGNRIAFLESLWSDRGVTSGDIIIQDMESGFYSNITEKSVRSYCDMHWDNKGYLHALWTSVAAYGISVYRDNRFHDVWSGTGTVSPSFASEFVLSDGKYALIFQDAENPQEVGLIHEKSFRRLSSENSGLLACRAYPYEIVRWRSPDGTEPYGIFRSAGPQRPVVVYIHGGPTSFSPLTFIDRYTQLIAEGFSVFMPNYRGSIGLGRDFAEANRGDMGGMDLTDILAGMDYLEATGRATSGKWFITGGSYGGFMTSWAITQTDRFKAAAGLFGISDWVSFHGTTNIPDWDSIHYNASPYSGNRYRAFSPMTFVEKVKTPVLLMHGREDPCVPMGQYLQFYRALKDMGKEVRLLVFPREGHGFTEKDHIVMSLRETSKWFKDHLS